jgi:pyrrolidone-carboxylate peptidase
VTPSALPIPRWSSASGRPIGRRSPSSGSRTTSTDNDGAVSAAEIDPAGPVAYRSTLPVDAIVAALRAEGIPAAASRDAGGFLCNHAFYVLMRLLEQERPGTTGGFVHVPAEMPPETLVRAARIVLAEAARP